MSKELETKVIEALKTVDDPELKQDFVSLGMVGDITFKGSDVNIVINLTTPACPLKGPITADIKAAVSQIEGINNINVEFGSKMNTGSKNDAMPGVKNIISVGSGKGGVGKSTIAANLAASLALEGAEVGLLDADIYGPSQAKMFGLDGKRIMADGDKNMIPMKAHGVKLISIANLVEDGQALTWRGPILHGTLTQMLQQTIWGELDYLIIDMPPGTGDVQLSLSQLAPLTGAVLVTTPQDVALLDVSRAHTMLKKTNIPVLGILENMSYYELPNGEKDFIFGEGGAINFAKEENINLLGQIPITRALRESGDNGTPLVLSEPDSPSSIALRKAARSLAGFISVQNAMSLPVI